MAIITGQSPEVSALLRAMGIDPATAHGLDIRIRPNEPVTAKVHRYVTDADLNAISESGAIPVEVPDEPVYVLEHPGRLSPEARRNLRESWDSIQRGQAGILEEGAKLRRVDGHGMEAQFARLLSLLSLPEEARTFILAALDPSAPADIWDDLADYLERQGRPGEARRFHLLAPASREEIEAAFFALSVPTPGYISGDDGGGVSAPPEDMDRMSRRLAEELDRQIMADHIPLEDRQDPNALSPRGF